MEARNWVGSAARPGVEDGFSTNAAIFWGVFGVHLDDAELVGHVQRLADGGDGCLGAALDVLLHHLGEVHAVNVVRAHHDDDVGVGVMDQVQGLVDGVGAAEEPALADALLRGDGGDVVAELRGHPPGLGNVAVKAVGLVLRQDHDLQVPGIDEVGQRKVDQPVASGKGHAGFGPVRRQWHETVSLAAGEDNGQDFLIQRHVVAPVRLRIFPKSPARPDSFTLEQFNRNDYLGYRANRHCD